jgi:molecular chaperone DnaK (HSP70)
MSVVGCDFGTLNTVIAVARNRGVDVVRYPSPFDTSFFTVERSLTLISVDHQ